MKTIMSIKHRRVCVLFLFSCSLLFIATAGTLRVANAAPQSGSHIGTSSLTGTWSGTFFSRHANVPAFSMTVVIAPTSDGHLIGNSSLNSECLKGVPLQVTINGTNVILAGSDDEGDSLTVRGSLDSTNTQLKASYIMNGSASGRCETDDGTGSLAKR
jgi:hypothetical protein